MSATNRLTRSIIRSKNSNPDHHTTPSKTCIAQKRFERALLDLIESSKVDGVCVPTVISNIADRTASLDAAGSRDVGQQIGDIGTSLEQIVSVTERFCNDYDEATHILENHDAGEGAGAVCVRNKLAALPPAVISQINRRLERSRVERKSARRLFRHCDSLSEVGKQTEKVMKSYDRNQTAHTILGPGGDYKKPIYA